MAFWAPSYATDGGRKGTEHRSVKEVVREVHQEKTTTSGCPETLSVDEFAKF